MRAAGGEAADTLISATDDTAIAAHSRMEWPRTAVNPAVDDRERYVFGEVFAAGGLGVVRRAEDRRLGRIIAVKELLKDSPVAQRRFALEAAITARLQHPAIVPLYDLGWRDSGAPFYCMKLVDGETLDARIRATTDFAGRSRLLEHVIAVADAIAYAHEQQIVHRDLKPANVLVGRFGETVVIDWGLAKDLTGKIAFEEFEPLEVSGVARSGLTVAGAVMGTLRYMAPEQARGERVDARSDIYSLGALLYHVLSGRPPFADAEGPLVLARVTRGELAELRTLDPQIPRELAAVAHRATALRPEDRYASAAALAEDLRRFQSGRLVSAHAYSLPEVLRLWLRRHRGLLVVAGLALAGLALTVVVAFLRVAQERDTATAAREEARHSLVRASAAESDRTEQLWHALLTQARASQRTLQPGQRFSSLEAIRRAMTLSPELGADRRLELRNAAIAGLSLADAKIINSWDAHIVSGFSSPAFDAGFTRYAVNDPAARTTIRRVEDDAEILTIPSAGHAPWYMWTQFFPGDRYLGVHYYNDNYYARDDRNDTYLYDLSRSPPVLVRRFHKYMAAFERDGRHAWITADDGEVVRHDTETWAPVRRLGVRTRPGHYAHLHLQAEGRYLAAHDEARKLWEVVDLTSEAIVATIPTGADPPASWGHDATLAIGEWGHVALWDVADNRRVAELGGYSSKLTETIFHPDRRILGTCSWDGTSRFWDAPSRRELLRLEGCFSRFSADGDAIAVQRFENAEIWQFTDGEGRVSFPGWARTAEFSRDGKLLLVAGDHGVDLWDVHAYRRLQRVTRDRCDSAIFGPDETGVFAHCHGSGLRAWAWQAKDSPTLGAPQIIKPAAATEDPGQIVVGAGSRIAAADERGIWVMDSKNLAEGTRLATEFPVRHLAISPDGRWLVSGSRWNEAIEVFDLAGGEAVRNLPCGPWGTAYAAFSPDGRWLATDAHDKYTLLNVGTWEPVRTAPSGHQKGSRPLVFSPDGDMLAVAAGSDEIHLLRTSDLSPLAALPQPTRDVWSLRFSPDGRMLAIAGGEHGVYVWDLPALRRELAGLGLDWDAPTGP